MRTPLSSLVAGGAGFIGSHLIDVLLQRGHEVFCVDNLITGSRDNIAHLQKQPHFHFLQHDLTVPFPDKMRKQIAGVRYVYHLASPASPPQYQRYSIETLLVNSIGTKHLLDVATEEKTSFLLTSTSEVYGNPLQHPQQEQYFGNVNPNGIRACYDEGKRFAEAMTMEYVRKHDVDARIVRIFNTYGPRMQQADGRVLSNFITQALRGEPLTIYGDGSQTRSFCFVADMVDGLIRLMETEGLQGEVVNIGYPKEHTILEMAHIIQKETGTSSEIIHLEQPADDPVKRRPDISKAQRLLHWEPKTPLSDGLRQMISFYREKMNIIR